MNYLQFKYDLIWTNRTCSKIFWSKQLISCLHCILQILTWQANWLTWTNSAINDIAFFLTLLALSLSLLVIIFPISNSSTEATALSSINVFKTWIARHRTKEFASKTWALREKKNYYYKKKSMKQNKKLKHNIEMINILQNLGYKSSSHF